MNSDETQDDLLKKMERYGYALMSPRDIAILMAVPSAQVPVFCQRLKEADTPDALAYRAGVARAKLDLHENIVKLAVKGSPAAQPLADSFIRDL